MALKAGLTVRLVGEVVAKELKVYNGERKPSATILGVGFQVKVKLPENVYGSFPDEGQPVAVNLTGVAEKGEWGLSIKEMKYLSHEGAPAAGPGPAEGSARPRPGV